MHFKIEEIEMLGLKGNRSEYRQDQLTLRADIIYRLVSFDGKLCRAIGQNKIPVAGYHYGSMKPLLDIVGRSKDIKQLLPGWMAWNNFVKEFRKSSFYHEACK